MYSSIILMELYVWLYGLLGALVNIYLFTSTIIWLDACVGIHILCMDAGWEKLREGNEYLKRRWSDKVEKTTPATTWKSWIFIVSFMCDLCLEIEIYSCIYAGVRGVN